jgi:ribose-phosphate pyrophosphokinase
MDVTVCSGSANTPLAAAMSHQPGVPLGSCLMPCFSDSVLHVELQESVRGHDVYLIPPHQSLTNLIVQG